jgi:hypothetical protein
MAAMPNAPPHTSITTHDVRFNMIAPLDEIKTSFIYQTALPSNCQARWFGDLTDGRIFRLYALCGLGKLCGLRRLINVRISQNPMSHPNQA